MKYSSIHPNSIRKEALQALKDLFQEEKLVVLIGKEGTGKSTLARQYAAYVKAQHKVVAWINAASDETCLADLCTTLEQFGLPLDLSHGIAGLLETLYGYLDKQPQALLVLDHIPLAFKVHPEKKDHAFQFLLITQLEQTPRDLPCLELTRLTEQEGAQLLLHWDGLEEVEENRDTVCHDMHLEARELTRELQGSLMALRLASGYLRVSQCTLHNSLELFRTYPTYLQLHPHRQEEVEIAGEICLRWLAQMHPEASDILQACAVLLPEVLPEAAVLAGEVAPAQQNSTVQLLLCMGMLVSDNGGALVCMHPLIQQLVAQFYELNEPPRKKAVLERLFCAWQNLLPTFDAEAVGVRLLLAGHIQQLAKLSVQWPDLFTEAAPVFAWAAQQLWAHQLLKPAEELAQRALTCMLATQGTSPIDISLALMQLGQIYAIQHKINEARACYEKVIWTAEKLNLRRHPVYCIVKFHLAQLAIEQEKWDEAEDLLRRVSVWKSVLGENHKIIVAAHRILAEVAAQRPHYEGLEVQTQAASR